MSDNHRRYRAIRRALTQCYPGELSGRMAQHVTVLAAFIRGIVGSKSSQLPSIASKIPAQATFESRVKRLSRWLDNELIKEEVYFLPYAEILLNCLALETLVLVMDGSGVGRGCCALMLHVIYRGRALPLTCDVQQQVSLPATSLRRRLANCIDVAVLYASLLEHADLNPVIMLVPGHAFVGWETWLESHQYEFLETTMTGTKTFEEAYQAGMEKYQRWKAFLDRPLFDPDGYARLLNVRLLQKEGITPNE